MIANIKILEKYCADYTQIENYDKALSSPLKYDLHHRLEISENKSRKDLIAQHLYYGRPPEELIFLEHSEHVRLHKEGDKNPMFGRTGENSPSFGKPSPNRGKHPSAESRQKMSDTKKGENNPMFGKHLSPETKQKISENSCKYWKGKHLSAETRQKLSENNCRYWKGKRSPNRGKHWRLENGRRVWTE